MNYITIIFIQHYKENQTMQIKLKCSPSFIGQSGGSNPKDKDRSRRSNKYSIPMSATGQSMNLIKM